jgi:hypothetical protein
MKKLVSKLTFKVYVSKTITQAIDLFPYLTENPEYIQEAAVFLNEETHGGEDVNISN